MTRHDLPLPRAPWSGVEAARVKEFQLQGRRLLQENNVNPLPHGLLMAYNLASLLALSPDLPGKRRAIILLIDLFCRETPATRDYLLAALISPSTGPELSRLIWGILGNSTNITMGGEEFEQQTTFHVILHGILPPGALLEESEDYLTSLLIHGNYPATQNPCNMHRSTWRLFHGRRKANSLIPDATLIALEHVFPERTVQDLVRIARALGKDPGFQGAVINNCLTLRKHHMEEFLSMVEEYNVEWAIASYDWNGE